MKRIVIELHESDYRKIKIVVATLGITLRELMIQGVNLIAQREAKKEINRVDKEVIE